MKKYFRLKKNNYCLYNLEKLYSSFDEAHKQHNGGLFGYIDTFEKSRCESIDELKNEIFNVEFASNVGKEKYSRCWKLVEEIINSIGVETYSLKYDEKPCIIVKCEELDDQFECDANRTLISYLKSSKELEDKNYNFLYEVYLINKDGSIKLDKNLSTYKI